MSVYVDNFLLALNKIKNLDKLKLVLLNTYNVKNFSKIRTFIRWQITRDLTA